MYIKNYNIHDILKLQIRTNNKCFFKGLNFPLSYFEVYDKLANKDIVLNIGKFTPSNNDCFLVDHKYYIKQNYIYCKEFSEKTKWEVEIFGFETLPTIINFNLDSSRMFKYIAPDLVAQDLILFPLLELSLGAKGYLFAHSGGFVTNDQLFLFFGRPGSQKTSILMSAFTNGSKILSDDRVILDLKSKEAYSFQLYPQIFEYLIKHLDDEHLSRFHKFSCRLSLLNEYVPNVDIFQKEPVDIKALYLLNLKNQMNENLKISQVDADTAIQKIIANNKAEIYGSSIPPIAKRRNFAEYMIAYSFIYPNCNIAKYWENLRHQLKETLKNTPIYEVEIPYNLGSQIYYEMEKVL